ncbi:PREDICTED: pre-mRNA-splicing factor CWC22 homolog [Diuraphis noxia]|uniref:pre-mRNA-splicing factor CWC22 homolog n=1 Tax=Diuraphis noxia TaxID=143948 RepID=UPI00076393CF|nr:PREDICTED: pre-mRNA-splicing factor CWC22 homolog [Diuraphis noxia]
MFDIYSSDNDEPQLNMSAFLSRGRYYSKINKAKMNDIGKMNEFSLSEQSSNWNNLKISIETAVQKLNPGNIRLTSTKLFELNIIRGKGLLCQSIMKAQSDSLEFTHIYATLVSFINCKFPNVAELLLIRCVYLFTNAYKCKEEYKCVPPVIFIAHLVHNNVAKDCLVLDILKMLIKTPNLHSIGMVDKIMKICGKKLNSNLQNENDLKYLFNTLQNISQDEQIGKSVQCLALIVLSTYQNHLEDEQQFDLVAPHKQYTHSFTLNCKYNPQYELDSFVYDLDFKLNEIIFKNSARQILKEKRKVYYFANYDFDENMADDEDDGEPEMNILSLSNTIAIKKAISIILNLNLTPFEVALELLKIQLIDGQEVDLCIEYLDCCFENCGVYNKFFTDIIQSFCLVNPLIAGALEFIFMKRVSAIHLAKPNSLKSLAKFFAQLLSSDIISWQIFSAVRLIEIEKTNCGTVFLKTMFDELILLMGNDDLKKRILHPSLQSSFIGLFPLNNRGNTLLCFNFFAGIGLYDVIFKFRESLSKGVAV